MYAERLYARLEKLAQMAPQPNTNVSRGAPTALGTPTTTEPQDELTKPGSGPSGLLRSSNDSVAGRAGMGGQPPIESAGMDAPNDAEDSPVAKMAAEAIGRGVARGAQKAAKGAKDTVKAGPAIVDKVQRALSGVAGTDALGGAMRGAYGGALSPQNVGALAKGVKKSIGLGPISQAGVSGYKLFKQTKPTAKKIMGKALKGIQAPKGLSESKD